MLDARVGPIGISIHFWFEKNLNDGLSHGEKRLMIYDRWTDGQNTLVNRAAG